MVYDKVYHGVFDKNLEHIGKLVQVYRSKKVKFFDKEFTFRIIGASHFITCDHLSYGELFSCQDVDVENLEEFDLKKGPSEHNFNFENGKFLTKTNVNIIKSEEFSDDERDFDLYHEFALGSFTGIKIKETSYQTVHTYPEYSIVVLTETFFKIK